MKLTRCDKCGEEVYNTPYRFVWLKGTKDIDLCYYCWIQFVEIVNKFLQDKDGEWLVKIPFMKTKYPKNSEVNNGQ